MREEIRKRIDMIRRGEVPAGYKKTKVGIVPEEWEIKQIKDCLKRIENPVEVIGKREYTQIGIRSHGKGIFYKEPVTGAALGNKKVYWIEQDCFIVNIVFAWEQAVAKTTNKEKGMIGSHRFPMYKPINNEMDLDWLCYYFLSQPGIDLMEYASPGGAGRNRTLGQDRFMKSFIYVPPKQEQYEIAKAMNLTTRRVEAQEALIEEKKNQKKWLVQNLLTGKIRIDGFDGEWHEIELGEAFQERVETNCPNEELLSITANGILPRCELEAKDNSSDDKSKYKKIYKGDIGYNTMRMWQGVSAYSEYQGIVSPAYTVLKPVKGDAKFFSYLFKLPEYINLFYRYSQGLVNDTLNLKYRNFSKIKIHAPKDIQEQQAIVTVLSAADKELQLLQQQLELYKQEKKAMMQLLLTGIVRVNELER